ncbi:MAG: hypothetical protein IAF02_19645 [Anaerolineae bacterium]|nr:hypothetical protein [Anaerolineae bacterium]
MATTKPVNDNLRLASLDQEIQEDDPRVIGRLGLLNGVLTGLAAAIGLWGIQVISLQPLPLTQKYNSIILAGGLIMLLCGLMGWVSARLRKTAVTIILWVITAFLITFIASYQPYQIRTLTAWLADTRFWGINIYPFSTAFNWIVMFWGMLLAGLFLLLLFAVLGLFQDTRLLSINQERGQNGRLAARAWTKLLLPLPLVILVSYLTASIIADTSWKGIPIIDRVIQVVREYDGDLFTLGLDDGINYAAARGVRDALDGAYTLSVGSIDADSLTTIIVADFENGAWIHCRFLNDQLNYCYDGSPPYTIGFNNLIAGTPIPEDCRGCAVAADTQWLNWLQERHSQLGSEPIIERTGMQGDFVIMQAQSATNDYAIQCWFQGSPPVKLLKCEEMN